MVSVSAQMMNDEGSPENIDGHAGVSKVVRRILLVDEQAHVLRVIRLNLERSGYRVDAVLSSDLALQQVRLHRYDALIMTSDLPDMTSGQLCEQTKVLLDGRDSGSPMPLMLVGHDEGVAWSDEADNREPLNRPVSLKLILARLDRYFDVSACSGAQSR